MIFACITAAPFQPVLTFSTDVMQISTAILCIEASLYSNVHVLYYVLLPAFIQN
jgi:hypothetical protein